MLPARIHLRDGGQGPLEPPPRNWPRWWRMSRLFPLPFCFTSSRLCGRATSVASWTIPQWMIPRLPALFSPPALLPSPPSPGQRQRRFWALATLCWAVWEARPTARTESDCLPWMAVRFLLGRADRLLRIADRLRPSGGDSLYLRPGIAGGLGITGSLCRGRAGGGQLNCRLPSRRRGRIRHSPQPPWSVPWRWRLHRWPSWSLTRRVRICVGLLGKLKRMRGKSLGRGGCRHSMRERVVASPGIATSKVRFFNCVPLTNSSARETPSTEIYPENKIRCEPSSPWTSTL